MSTVLDNSATSTESLSHDAVSAMVGWEHVIGDITHLAQSSSRAQGFFVDVLARIARRFESPFATIEVRLVSQVVSHDWHWGPTDPAFWSGAVKEILAEALSAGHPVMRTYHAKDDSVAVAVLSAIIRDEEDAAIGAVAMVVPSECADDAKRKQEVLKSLVAMVSFCGGIMQHSQVSDGRREPDLGILQRSASCESLKEFAFAVVNNLCQKAACEQVSLGVVRGSKVKVEAVSAFDELSGRTPGVSRIREAMEECLDMASAVTYHHRQAWADNSSREYRLHKRWSETTGQSAVASVPLWAGDKIVAIVSLRRNSSHPFKPKHIDAITESLRPSASAISLVTKATRGLAGHTVQSLAVACGNLVSPGHWAGKIVLGVVLALGLWVAFGTMSHSLTVDATVVPQTSRQICAPHQALLLSAPVVAGDQVHKGDILCRFDTTKLDLQRKKSQAALALARLDEQRAIGEASPVDAALARANRKRIEAELDITDYMIEQSVIRAPFDGVVTRGDLRTQIGSSMPIGQPLFEIASDKGQSLKLYIPQERAACISAGLVGDFASSARPELPQTFKLYKVMPNCTQADGRNVCVVEAKVDAPADWIRPGMVGIAKVHAGRRPVWWVLSHRVLNYLRLRFLL